MVRPAQLNRILLEMRPVGEVKGIVMLVIRHKNIYRAMKAIPKDLVEEYERFSHITIQYGVNEYDPERLQNALDTLSVKLDTENVVSGFGYFEGVQEGKCDCVFLKVNDAVKDQLAKVKDVVKNNLECDPDRFPEYKPHITLAYVKLGKGKEIAEMLGEKYMDLELDKIWIDDTLFFSNGSDKESTLYLNMKS